MGILLDTAEGGRTRNVARRKLVGGCISLQIQRTRRIAGIPTDGFNFGLALAILLGAATSSRRGFIQEPQKGPEEGTPKMEVRHEAYRHNRPLHRRRVVLVIIRNGPKGRDVLGGCGALKLSQRGPKASQRRGCESFHHYTNLLFEADNTWHCQIRYCWFRGL